MEFTVKSNGLGDVAIHGDEGVLFIAPAGAFRPNIPTGHAQVEEVANLLASAAEVTRQRDELLAACEELLAAIEPLLRDPGLSPAKRGGHSVYAIEQARAAIAAIEDPLTRPGVAWEELGRGFTADEPDQTYGAAD